MKVTTFCAGVVVSVAALLVPATAQAAPVSLFTFTTSYNTQLNSFNIGNEFKTSLTQELYVSAIGAFIAPSQISGGLTTVAYTSTLYADNNTTVLASATIPVGTAVDAQSFAYTPLTYVLAADENYVLTSYAGPNVSVYTYSLTGGVSTGTWNAGTTFIQNWYNANGAGPATSTNGGYREFMGGNLLVDTVPPPGPAPVPAPEPTTALLLGFGMLAMAMNMRARRRAATLVN